MNNSYSLVRSDRPSNSSLIVLIDDISTKWRIRKMRDNIEKLPNLLMNHLVLLFYIIEYI